MKITILLLAMSAAVFSSCSTAYKSGQTPDDVYYSPVRVIEENKYEEEDKITDSEERQIRMAARDRRWRDMDRDWDYNRRYDPYNYGHCYGYYYNPYYYRYPVYFYGIPVSNPKNSSPRLSSLGSYYNTAVVVTNPKTGASSTVNTRRTYNRSNNTREVIRSIITPETSSGSSRSSGNNSRTYSPSSSSSSSGSATNAGSVPRPARKD